MPPEERRQERVDLAEKFNDLKIEVAVLSSKIEEWMSQTKEYRGNLCLKLDKVSTVLENNRKEVDSIRENCLTRPPKCLDHIAKEIGNKMKLYIGLSLGIPGLIISISKAVELLHRR